jgi:hypothetical protein
MAPYRYQVLKPGEIRILKLHQDLKDARTHLYCTLEHVEASYSSAQYTALSYAWGDPEKPYNLQVRSERGVDEGTLPLTKNLHDAIHDLASSEIEPKVFWIDQICLYFDRYRTKYRGNLMIEPQFSEGFRFVLGARMSPLPALLTSGRENLLHCAGLQKL